MKTILSTIFAALIMLTPSYAFVGGVEFGEKCKRSDAIIRGVVVDIVTVAGTTKNSRGQEESILEEEWSGPRSVAIVRIVSVLKGDAKSLNTIMFIPCGYDFDESPCELTKSKDYILFLESMGHGYFHPLDPFSMHRVQKDQVGMSGFDWEGDFDPKEQNGKSIAIEEFTKRVADAKNQ